jgi:NAD+ kinase
MTGEINMRALIVCKHPHEKEHPDIHKIIENSGLEITYAWKNTLTKGELADMDLVISVGGDGTALSASHFIEDKPLLAVNSSPETSIGALTTLNLGELKEKLGQISKESFKTENLERIEVAINGNPAEHLALNEVFIASDKAYHISKYKIKFKNEEELQRSSGLIFSTGTGSTAWFKSAGGIPFSPQAKFIRMIVREPYCGKNGCKRIKNIEIKENEQIEIIPLVKSVLAIDSIREYFLNPEDRVTIKISMTQLRRII